MNKYPLLFICGGSENINWLIDALGQSNVVFKDVVYVGNKNHLGKVPNMQQAVFIHQLDENTLADTKKTHWHNKYPLSVHIGLLCNGLNRADVSVPLDAFITQEKLLEKDAFKEAVEKAKANKTPTYGKPLVGGRENKIFDESLNPYIFINGEGNVISANKTALKLLGYTKAEVSTLTVEDLRYLSPELSFDLWERVVHHTIPARGEAILKGKNNTKIFVEYQFVTNIYEGVHLLSVKDISLQTIAYQKQKISAALYKAGSMPVEYEERFSKLIEALVLVVDYEYGELWWFNKEQNELVLEESYTHEAAKQTGQLFAIDGNAHISLNDENWLAKSFKDYELCFSDNLAQEKEFSRSGLSQSDIICKGLCVTLTHNGAKKGVLLLVSRSSGTHNPTEEEVLKDTLFALRENIGNEIVRVKDIFNYEKLIENAREIIAILGFNTIFYKVNKAFQNILGYSLKEIQEVGSFAAFTERDLPKIQYIFSELAEGRSVENQIFEMKTKGGELKLIEFSAIPDLREEKIFILGRDVTSREQAKEKIEIANKKFTLATRSSNIGMWETNPNTQEIYFDNGMRDIFEVNAEHISMHVEEWKGFLNPDEVGTIEEAFQQAFKLKEPIEIEHSILVDAGQREKFVKTFADVLTDKEGNAQSLVGLTIDITAVKRSESQKEHLIKRLKKRIKEQVCLYHIYKISYHSKDLEDLLKKVFDLIPKGFSHPDSLAVHLSFGKVVLEHDHFNIDDELLTAGKKVVSDHTLALTVSYPKLHPNNLRFDYEEELLLEAISDYLVTVISQILATNDLKVSENRFRNLIEHNYDAVVIQREDYTIAYASPAIEGIIGYKPQEMMNANAHLMTHPDDVERLWPAMDKLWRKEISQLEIKERVIHKEGHYIWVKAHVSDQRHVQGVEGIVYNIRDINEAEKARKALKSSEERLRTAQKAAKLGYFIIDAQNPDNVVWSDEIYEILQLPKSFKPINTEQFMDEFVHPEDREMVKEDVANLEAGDEAEVEHRILRKDGSICWVKVTLKPIEGKDGQPFRLNGTMQDITEKNNYIEAIKRQNNILNEIARTQSHIVRAPLARLMGLADVVDSPNITENERQYILTNLRESAHELDAIVTGIIKSAQPNKI